MDDFAEQILRYLSTINLLIGFLLALIPQWFLRRKKIMTNWAALSAETEMCRVKAKGLVSAGVQSPLYRFPTTAYRNSLPSLIAEGQLTESEISVLLGFASLIEDINRSLDYNHELMVSNDEKRWAREKKRGIMKARRLTLSEDDSENNYLPARNVIRSHLNVPWWRYSGLG